MAKSDDVVTKKYFSKDTSRLFFTKELIIKFDNLLNKADEILGIIKINNKHRKERIQNLEKVAVAL